MKVTGRQFPLTHCHELVIHGRGSRNCRGREAAHRTSKGIDARSPPKPIEFLYDNPTKTKSKVRVAWPFTSRTIPSPAPLAATKTTNDSTPTHYKPEAQASDFE